MNRLLTSVVFAAAGLMAAMSGFTAWWIYAPPDGLWCGNVIIDPIGGLLKVVAPVGALGCVLLIRRCWQIRRGSVLAGAAILTFLVSMAGLGYEVHILKEDYGLEICRIWWLPRSLFEPSV